MKRLASPAVMKMQKYFNYFPVDNCFTIDIPLDISGISHRNLGISAGLVPFKLIPPSYRPRLVEQIDSNQSKYP
jgi:hypothetical protein